MAPEAGKYRFFDYFMSFIYTKAFFGRASQFAYKVEWGSEDHA